jgi:hypothetical protein
MMRRLLLLAPLLACTTIVGSPVARAADAPTAPPVAGWNEFVDGLRALPDRLLAKLPASERADPQVQQEVARVVLESLAISLIDAIGGDGDHPAFLPNGNIVMNFPQPNADTVYRASRVTPGSTYRLQGQRGTLRLLSIGQVAVLPGGRPGPTRSYLDLNTLHVDKQGRFDLILSPARPQGYSGDWWQLEQGARTLLLRMVSSDWSKERDPTIAIERLDRPPQRGRPSAADLEQRLRSLPRDIAFLPMLFIDHAAKLRAEGTINRLKAIDVSQIGGLAGQSYYEGAFELGEDEALLVEAPVPAHCSYRSILLGNDIHETIDWSNNQSSLNDSQAKPDKDGILRIVVSAKDPGVPNWLDTAGHRRGLMQGRWLDCTTNPLPTVNKVPLAALRAMLPPDTPRITPEERQAALRERRTALQHRPLW